MSDISLSKAVRSNLLSLQNTSSLLNKTQERLSTGNKVNSALDNPTNFFTASALNSRAGDLNNLLDSIANGIKTIEQADNGLTAITKNLESLQSTLRQARQDKSFQTSSYTIDPTAIGTTTLKSLSFSGGAVGATPVAINLNTLAGSSTPTTLTGASANFSTNFTGGNLSVNGTNVAVRGDTSLTATTLAGAGANFGTNFTSGAVSINGTSVNIRGDQSVVNTTLTGSGGATLAVGEGGNITVDLGGTFNGGNPFTVITADGDTTTDVITAINTAFTAAGGTGTLAADDGAGQIAFTSTSGEDIVIADAAGNTNGTAAALGFTGAGATSTNGTVAFDATATTVASDISGAGITGLTATVSGGQLALSLASGADITVTTGTTATAIGFGSSNLTSTNGNAAFDATAVTVAADFAAAGITGLTADGSSGQVALSLASGADLTITGGTLATAVGFGTGNVSSTNGVEGSLAAVKTADTLVSEINNNASLKGKIRASNDNGKLRIENLSTSELNVDGASLAGVLDGASSGVAKVGGNTVRSDLADQYNELRDQLDKLADDGSFNGTNLLSGDNLKITFNETGTSSIDIHSKNSEAINAKTLGVETTLVAADLDSDTKIDSLVENVKTALNKVRTQSSAFGSNLSIVQNREDFTKKVINTLETGAANLTLADANQEAANVLALQTRQSLSTSALSLASQGDQNVLQLLR
ncbi:flagellin [uncultured Devosia sp.]|uniref:flagellin N-terminal helical domain-containing protein n=1 Tax=uncultured Devosia sp. TaxID=211434 RepID=UPI0035CC2079